ncbi:uncharacterized protein Z520_05328 [Fonsecaea multimorphosa CBS 102226]|uniref:Piwi domain-containing protein n=1 Tax=Fonsecaea multimorphosa CBS 102226 TaxID=1442371 RepID=A0A0D2JZC5_9EURO|nr:uncharacterized protein Z520_05328 [Fonsecaea multimorphosa CBS 102226]KIX98867.1 hypothetical protein Z520_05328 [Fonsecaea multimorphosa CBS 102226]
MSGRGSRGGGADRGLSYNPRGSGRGDRGSGRGDRGSGRGDRGSGRGGRGSGRGRGFPTQVSVYRPDGDSAIVYDSTVKRIEEEIQANIQRSKGSSAATNTLPERPGFGTKGKEILLWTNYFELTGYGNLLLYRYSIDISPIGTGKGPGAEKTRRLVQLLLEDHFSDHELDVVTDFKSNILSKVELDLLDHYRVPYRQKHEQDPSPNAPVFQITLRQTAALSTSELLDYVTSTRSATLFGSKDELIQALNIVMGYHPKAASDIANIGAHKHYSNAATTEKFNLGAGLQAIRGFFMSTRAATARILVNVQVKYGAFFEEGPLEGLINVFLTQNGNSKLKLENFLKRLSVSVTHIQRKDRRGRVIPRIKQIFGLASQRDGQQQLHRPVVSSFGAGPKEVKFFLAGADPGPQKQSQRSGGGSSSSGGGATQGEYISVYDFFKQTYNLVIRDIRLPVVNVGSKQNPSYLPAQVCHVIGGQHTSTKLSAFQTQNMIRFAVRPPEQNARFIATSGVSLLGLVPTNATLNNFGLEIKPNLLCVPGRVLDGPRVLYHGRGITNPRAGSWNLQNVRFSTISNLPYWTYLAISMRGSALSWGSEQMLQTALDGFTQKLNELGITAVNHTPGLTITLDHPTVEREITSSIHKFMHSEKRKPPSFLLVILPSKDTRIYNCVKFVCDIKEGLLNICTVGSKFVKPHNDQYFANVALKVNLKLGGRNHSLDNQKLGIVAEGKTMIVGLDVTHPSPGSAKTAPSVSGIVASVDNWLGQWPAELLIQRPGEEMITGLQPLIKSRLKLWQKLNKSLPDNILVYRDGVSEGQYNLVLEKELPSFRAACKELYPPDKTKNGFPHITIIVVGKRHNTRFYPTKEADADRSSNPPNGTIVDRGVTEARNWDFFLQAHTALQGTARPAHYYIVLDEIFRRRPVKPPFNNPADVLEDLTHNLCYLFGRATKAVSICPPAYYADLVCERSRCYLSGLFDPEIAESGSTSTQSTQLPDPSAVRLHPNVQNSMFYV